MKTQQILWKSASGWNSPNIPLPDAQLVLVFGAIDYISKSEHYPILHDLFPKADIAFVSTAGEITQEGFSDNTIVATAIEWEKTKTKLVCIPNKEPNEVAELGRHIGAQLHQEDLKHILVFGEGHALNGDLLVQGMRSAIQPRVAITGGLAGDAGRFTSTFVGLNDDIQNNNVIAIGLYGDSLSVNYNSHAGWDVFGPIRTVTKSTDNILYTLDNESALALFKKYLGSRANELPGAALLFPLCILKSDGTQIVRTILSIDDESQSMTFAGNVPEGSRVQFMMGNFDRIIEGAGIAASKAAQENGTDLNILVSCVGRKIILQNRVDEEIEMAFDNLKNQGTFCGFYSNGEICPASDGISSLHNQTMTITTIKEV